MQRINKERATAKKLALQQVINMKKPLFYLLWLSTLYTAKAQSFVWELGNNLTAYQYTQANGEVIDYFKKGTGGHLQIGMEFAMLDTANLQAKALLGLKPNLRNRADFFTRNPLLARAASMLYTDVNLSYNQWNAVGDTQNIPINYSTNFVGVIAGIGPKIPLYAGFSLSVKGKCALQKLMQGTQQLNNNYLDLMTFEQFTPIQWMLGYQVELSKKVNSKIQGFVNYQYLTSANAAKAGESHLIFKPQTLSMGIKIAP